MNYYPPHIETDQQRAEYDQQKAEVKARNKDAIKTIKEAGLRYESVDGGFSGLQFKLFEPIENGKFLTIDQVLEFLQNRKPGSGSGMSGTMRKQWQIKLRAKPQPIMCNSSEKNGNL